MENKAEKKSKKSKQTEAVTEQVTTNQNSDIFSDLEIQKHLEDLKKSGKKYKTICKLF